MNSIVRILLVATAGLSATACATHETAKLDAATTLAASPVDPHRAANQGKNAISWRDNWTAANLFEEAVAARPTVLNRFNLASAYHRTGRTPEAAVIYRQLAVEGQYTTIDTDTDHYRGKVRTRRVNMANEASRRLALIDGSIAYAQRVRGGGVVSAADLGTPASATAGAAPTSRRVSDERARQLDEAAARARGKS